MMRKPNLTKKKGKGRESIQVRILSRSKTREAIYREIKITTTKNPRWKSRSVAILPVIALEAYVCGYNPLLNIAIACDQGMR